MNLRLCGLIVCLLLSSCAQSPQNRALSIETTACGHASRTSGAGVIVGHGLALVAAHVVIGATEVTVLSDDRRLPAKIVRLDTRTDLALLTVNDLEGSTVRLGTAKAGDTVNIIGGGPTPSLDVVISKPVEVRIEEVRSQVRSSRTGYEIEHRVQLGDSGAGVFDDNGDLIGVVFGRIGEEQERSFIVDAEEIAEILDGSTAQNYSCDPAESRVVAR
jgi:S1-C subfamily serine protease